ncbi:unnamed protein product, partial [Urochloa humidicola]
MAARGSRTRRRASGPQANMHGVARRDELLAMWEGKTGRAFELEYVPEDAVLERLQSHGRRCAAESSAMPLPLSVVLAPGTRLRDRRPGQRGWTPASFTRSSSAPPSTSTSTGSSQED